jgi:hypothetical protein
LQGIGVDDIRSTQYGHGWSQWSGHRSCGV